MWACSQDVAQEIGDIGFMAGIGCEAREQGLMIHYPIRSSFSPLAAQSVLQPTPKDSLQIAASSEERKLNGRPELGSWTSGVIGQLWVLAATSNIN